MVTNTSAQQRPLRILLVEDDPDDIELTRLAFARSALRSRLEVVTDGPEALERLRAGSSGRAERPDLVLLDLDLPTMDGLEVLEAIKNDELLALTPVVVLSTSSDTHDIRRAYLRHANCYVTKCADFVQFAEEVAVIERFWLDTAKLPAIGSTA